MQYQVVAVDLRSAVQGRMATEAELAQVLTAKVSEALSVGWKPQGGVAVLFTKQTVILYQALSSE